MSKIILEESYINSINEEEDYAKNVLYSILEKAIEEDASDIHIEPHNNKLIIRARIDGELKQINKFKIEEYPLISRFIKLSAGMNITEKRLPQDGGIDTTVKELDIDIRVSTIPTIYGEKIVLRILNREKFLKNKIELGFSKEAISKMENIVNKNSGIIIITGTTGSGKTTTLYSILNDLRNTQKNIMTIEDPVEYRMEGINQIQVNDKVGLTFEKGLRAILRQDPDIIIVGEIRDAQTAKIAIRAAVTGHLVISTMHTKDALSSIERLLEMDIPLYLVSSSLIGVISQKLIKKVCSHCSHDITIKEDSKYEINTKVAKGCEKCKNTGYLGRTIIYEILDVDAEIKAYIQDKKDAIYIKDKAIEKGMITFDESTKYLGESHIFEENENIVIENIVR